jgi:hypothetical protein
MGKSNNDLISKLQLFYTDLKSYQARFEHLRDSKMILGHWIREKDELREKLVREAGELSIHISELTGANTINIYELERTCSVDMWELGLRPTIDTKTSEALILCVDYTNRAIGKLKDDINKGVRDKQGNILQKHAKLSFLHKIWGEVKDFIATIIAKFMAEKTK